MLENISFDFFRHGSLKLQMCKCTCDNALFIKYFKKNRGSRVCAVMQDRYRQAGPPAAAKQQELSRGVQRFQTFSPSPGCGLLGMFCRFQLQSCSEVSWLLVLVRGWWMQLNSLTFPSRNLLFSELRKLA